MARSRWHHNFTPYIFSIICKIVLTSMPYRRDNTKCTQPPKNLFNCKAWLNFWDTKTIVFNNTPQTLRKFMWNCKIWNKSCFFSWSIVKLWRIRHFVHKAGVVIATSCKLFVVFCRHFLFYWVCWQDVTFLSQQRRIWQNIWR